MKQRPMVLIFAGVLSGTAVVWNIMSMTAAFYLLTGICLLASLIFSDRRYGWVVVGILAGILLSLGFKTSMKLDLIQVKEKATEYTMGRVLEVSKTKKGKLAVLLKIKIWRERSFYIHPRMKRSFQEIFFGFKEN